MHDLVDLLRAWPVGSIQAITPATSGAVNQTWLVTTPHGRYALRAYRHLERQRVADEHAIIGYARKQGIPAIAPVPLPDGTTILERAGHFYALFPHAEGEQLRRDDLSPDACAAMGTCLAQLHAALRNFSPAQLQERVINVDRAATLARMTHFEQHIRALAAPAVSDEYALRRLLGQRAAVERSSGSVADLATLQHQPIHGDYQEANLFFAAGRVSAIIDWDQAYLAPRAWEVIRTFDLVWRFAPEACAAFLAAYRAIAPLPLHDLDIAARCYGLMRAHDVWMYEAIYAQGNDRVRAYMLPEGFVPIETRWAALRRTLA